MSNVTLIPATLERYQSINQNPLNKKRVAVYARVSTDREDQSNSYDSQVNFYTEYIKSRTDWEFIKVYTDEGITGTSIKKRPGFQSMINDALSGKIDLIITKSVSRFARNTVDSLTTIRKLKEKNVECFFEKENIWTFDGKGELLITIMSSLAQEESRSISENCTWGWRKRMSDGKVSVPYSHFLGYDKGENGELVINEKEAKIVRLIFSEFLKSHSPTHVAKVLTQNKIKTPFGKDKWYPSTILSMLKNEKYIGDALLQKTFTSDFLTKKIKINMGEIQQYYVKNNHPGIIDKEIFDMVQDELIKKKHKKNYSINSHIFSGKIFCGKCGSMFGSKVWHSTDKYKRTIWQCNEKYKEQDKCNTEHLYDEDIKDAFITAANTLSCANEATEAQELINTTIFNTDIMESEINKLKTEIDLIVQNIDKEIKINATVAQDQSEYEKRYNTLCGRYQETKEKIENTQNKINDLKSRKAKADEFFKNIKNIKSPIETFDEELFDKLVEKAIVYSKENIKIIWKNGN